MLDFLLLPGADFNSDVRAVNMLNLFLNVGGIALLEYAPVAVGLNISFCSAVVGALLTGVALGWHFGRVRGKDPLRFVD